MDVRQLLTYAVALVEAATLARLVRLGLAGRYRWFAVYLALDLGRSLLVVTLGLTPAAPAYARLWIWSEPLMLAVQIMVGLELYRRIAEHYRNFRKVGKLLALVAGVAAIVLCAWTVRFDLASINWRWPSLQFIMLAKRCVLFSLAAFLGMTAIFFTQFPIPLRRNVRSHGRLLALYFGANMAGYLALNLRGPAYVIGTLLMAIGFLCFLGWATLMTRAGESVPVLPPVSEDEYDATTREKNALLGIAKRL